MSQSEDSVRDAAAAAEDVGASTSESQTNDLTLAKRYPKLTIIGMVIWLATMTVLIFGITKPALTVEAGIGPFKQTNTVSLWSGIKQLNEEGKVALAIIIFCFSIVTPNLKLLSLVFIWFLPRRRPKKFEPQLRFLEVIGRWSMLDVFVAAVLVVVLKLRDLFRVDIHIAIYLFCACVLLTMTMVTVVRSLARRLDEQVAVTQ